MTNTQENNHTGSGAALITLAFFFVALMGTISKLAKGISVEQLVFFQSFIAFCLYTPYLIKKRLLHFKREHLKIHLLRSLAGLFSQALMLIAVRKMLIANAILLSNSAPLFIPFLAKFFLKKKISMKIWISLLIGMTGIVFILNPSGNIFEQWATFIALGAAFFSAVALLSVNELSKVSTKENILFNYFLISSTFTAPFAISHWRNPIGMDWIYLAGIGLSMLIAQVLIIKAYKYATASRIAPFNYTVVLFSTFMGEIFWNEMPKGNAVAGIILVCIGGILTTFDHKPKHGGIYGNKSYSR